MFTSISGAARYRRNQTCWTRWLYFVECPQYSTRLEALGYLCTSCLLPAFDEASVTWLNSRWWLTACDWVMSVICRVVNPCRTSHKIWGGFFYAVYRPGEWLWIDSNGKMETKNPVEGYFGSELAAICNHCGTLAAWSRKTTFLRIFCVFLEKLPHTVTFSKFCSKSFHRETDRLIVLTFLEIWPTGNRWNGALLNWRNKKNKISPNSVHFRRSYSRINA